eukprot:scaffold53045_cov25-Tisochrysis_lutea.AAC.1
MAAGALAVKTSLTKLDNPWFHMHRAILAALARTWVMDLNSARSMVSPERSRCTRSSSTVRSRSAICLLRTTWLRHNSRPRANTGVRCC